MAGVINLTNAGMLYTNMWQNSENKNDTELYKQSQINMVIEWSFHTLNAYKHTEHLYCCENTYTTAC